MTTYKKDVTVYIGRFNPFHLGHAHVLERSLKTSKLTIVLVGSSGQARNLKNPFTFAERKEMIQAFVDQAPVGSIGDLIILPLRDYPYSHNTWIKSVQHSVTTAVEQYCKEKTRGGNPMLLTDVHITGSDRDDSTWYLKSFPQWKKDFVDAHNNRPANADGDISATSVRQVLYESRLFANDFASLDVKVPHTTTLFLWRFANAGKLESLRREYDFIKKYKERWSTKPSKQRVLAEAQQCGITAQPEALQEFAEAFAPPYAPTFNCADAVVIQSGHILVVKRGSEPGKGLWALPGGFINQNERSADAAVRELIEETGIRLATGKRALEITESMLKGSIKDKELFDDPERSARGRTFTTAYLFRLDDTKPLPIVKGQNVPTYESGGKDIVETEDAFWLLLDRAIENPSNWFEDHWSIVNWAMSVKDSN